MPDTGLILMFQVSLIHTFSMTINILHKEKCWLRVLHMCLCVKVPTTETVGQIGEVGEHQEHTFGEWFIHYTTAAHTLHM